MFEFIDIENHKYDSEKLAIELKQALYEYNDAAEKVISASKISVNAMLAVERDTAKEIVLTEGKALSWDDMLATGVKRCPELRTRWVMANLENTEAKERLIMAKNKVDALIAIAKILSRS